MPDHTDIYESFKQDLLEDVETNMDRSAENLYNDWLDDTNPDVFGFLELANDGGFPEIKDLYQTKRLLSLAGKIAVLFGNVSHLLQTDLAFISNPHAAADKLGADASYADIDKFYITRTIVEDVCFYFGYEAPQTVRILGVLEIMGLMYFVLALAYQLSHSLFNRGYHRWLCASKLFLESLPELMLYSGMRMLKHVVPAIVAGDLATFRRRFQFAKKSKAKMQLARDFLVFCLRTSVCAIIGMDMFLLKMRVVSASANRGHTMRIHTALCTGLFCMQVLAIVNLGVYARERLFVFIFGGEDATLQNDEVVRKTVWNTMLTKRCFLDMPPLQAVTVMATFTDRDFQKLVLNENHEMKLEQRKAMFGTENMGKLHEGVKHAIKTETLLRATQNTDSDMVSAEEHAEMAADHIKLLQELEDTKAALKNAQMGQVGAVGARTVPVGGDNAQMAQELEATKAALRECEVEVGKLRDQCERMLR